MRLRNVKNKEEIMKKSSYLIVNPSEYKGRWNQLFNNDNPIYLEIGMGKGQFIINNANSDKNLIFNPLQFNIKKDFTLRELFNQILKW